MRGKDCRVWAWGVCEGITPAYAGKSYNQGILSTDFKDHPRLCGEKFGF